MLQRRQIVKAVDNRIDIEDPEDKKYAITTLHSIAWMFISIIVTIYRTVPLPRHQSTSHWIMMTTTEPRNSV
jgi:hypothetical protein